MSTPDATFPHRGRLRRWLMGLGLLFAMIAAYGLSLNWFAHRLGASIEKSVHAPEPVDREVMSPR